MSLPSSSIPKVRHPYLQDKDESPPRFGRTVMQPRVVFHSEDQNQEAHEYTRRHFMSATSLSPSEPTVIPTNQSVSPTSVITTFSEDDNDYGDTSPSKTKLRPLNLRHQIGGFYDFPTKKSTQTFRAGMMKMILIVVLVTIGIRHWFWSSPPSQSVWKNESLETKTMKAHNDPIANTNTNTIISQEIKEKHRAWAKILPKHAKLKAYDLDGPPGQIHWDWHPTKRLDRFPSVEERIQYYMGKWYDVTNLKLYGTEFRKAVYIYWRSSRKYGHSSTTVVNLFDLSPEKFFECFETAPRVTAAYCRDYVNLAILRAEGSANMILHIGDEIPSHRLETDSLYPMFNKVRFHCKDEQHPVMMQERALFQSRGCNKDHITTIIWPLNRHRHFSFASHIPNWDIPWNDKKPVAMWRGGPPQNPKWRYKENMPLLDTIAMKWRLVSRHSNSSSVDAKFAFRFDGDDEIYSFIPDLYCAGNLTPPSEQLVNKYLLSIEGNDVSSGLKWMLFSNSVVLMPPIQFESWAMESLLEPYVHFIPIKPDFSDVEEQIQWAESNQEKAQRIAERSTLFIYDLLYHPDAVHDENLVLEGIMERYEQNFGALGYHQKLHPLDHIHRNWHPLERHERFPSQEERIQYYMGKWFSGPKVSMKRKTFSHPKLETKINDQKLQWNREFVASGEQLEKCVSSHGDLKSYCNDALPDFDERSTADLKGGVKIEYDESQLAEKSSIEGNNIYKSLKLVKKNKRVLLDDSIKIVRFGDANRKEWADVPVFAKSRIVRQDKDSTTGLSILWEFDSSREFDLILSGDIEKADTPFASKVPRAIWRGGYGTLRLSGSNPRKNVEFKQRYELVKSSVVVQISPHHDPLVDAKFLIEEDDSMLSRGQREALFPQNNVWFDDDSRDDPIVLISHMMTFRYIIATEDDWRIHSDLKWMLLSQSVVLMPDDRRFTSWFMEDRLEPFVHFVPIDSDYNNVSKQIKWCEENRDKVEQISERATLFIHDMFFHQLSDHDNSEIKFKLMDRYKDRFDF